VSVYWLWARSELKTLTDFEQNTAPLIATSRAVANLPGLADLLGTQVIYRWNAADLAACAGVIAWGRKPSAIKASVFANCHGLRLLRLEDGFLRSVGMGSEEPPLSIVVDADGIYYDASGPSGLEALISKPLTEAQEARALALIGAWRAARVSKYNHAREFAGKLPERYVLVVDQTLGDASISYGQADGTSFQRMLEAALAEKPECMVLLKVHPEVMAGRKRGHFDLPALARNSRVMVLGEDLHPASLLEHADAIYVVTSQMGFEGLLWGKQVRTFGMPFYAGWGLTEDELPAPQRRRSVPLEHLVHAALVDYPRYIDPETNQRCDVERVIAWMDLQRKMRERFPATVYALGFSIYKKPIVRGFFQGSDVRFVRQPWQIPDGEILAVWGRREVFPSIDRGEVHRGIRLVRLEDGFLRSVGLGADLVRPISWVMDRQGIYYDATQPSDLEHILQTINFDEALIARARALRERLVAEGLTKYNVGGGRWMRPYPAPNREGISSRVILVPGQVESDASLAYGAPGIRHNLDLLRVVRESNPDAYLIYKPHPDVVAGLRRKGCGEGDAAQWCDEVVLDVPMGELLSQVDEVHILTSLAGFEALLRGKKVVCYGQPFYAGWGLTEDKQPPVRRTRRLTLDELVAGVLILYPVYVSRITGRFTTPEHALDELLTWRDRNSSGLSWWRMGLRWALRVAKS
jgi:capsular polysaccharide export protein